MARPARLELATPCLEAARSTLPNLARGVANRANSASWNKLPQTIFSFICRHLLHICRYFPRFALHFRDKRHYQPNTVEPSLPSSQAAEFRITGVEKIRTNGHEMSVLASTNAEAVVERARDLNAVSVEVAPVGLRDIFLETVKED